MGDPKTKIEESRKEDDELRLLYQVTVQDLAFFKQQQWSVTNYGLLLYAAIVGIPQIPNAGVTPCERLVLCLLATALAAGGAYLLYKLERSIKARRDRLSKIRRLFTKAFCLAWRSKYKDPDAPTTSILLGAILIVGAGAVWWLVYFKAPPNWALHTDAAKSAAPVAFCRYTTCIQGERICENEQSSSNNKDPSYQLDYSTCVRDLDLGEDRIFQCCIVRHNLVDC